jgi:hypothetical protein
MHSVKHIVKQCILDVMKKDPAAVSLGRKGGLAAAKKRTKEERRQVASHAAKARWAKRDTIRPS